jgi:hypothetical protein
MSKETFYFPHDYDSTSDPKMQAFIGIAGQTYFDARPNRKE